MGLPAAPRRAGLRLENRPGRPAHTPRIGLCNRRKPLHRGDPGQAVPQGGTRRPPRSRSARAPIAARKVGLTVPRDDVQDGREARETPDGLRCKETNADGSPCGALPSFVDPETGYCRSHDPEKRDELRKQASKGGETTARRHHGKGGLTTDDLPPLTDHEAAELWTDAIGRAAATDRLSAAAANACLRAVQTFLSAREAGQVSDRLEALTDALAAWRKTGDPEPVLQLVEEGAS